ncbi:MAG TPA: LuxR C-terminal-related transcriptional regulator [Burkholderiaceae bacterium]|jgi:two-component system response regulator DctR
MLHIIHIDEEIRNTLLQQAKLRKLVAIAYKTSQAFLDELYRNSAFDLEGNCVLLNAQMDDRVEENLFDILVVRKLTQRLPVIFLASPGHSVLAVDVLRRGAFDFFDQHYDDVTLFGRIVEALCTSKKYSLREKTQSLLATLSPREREVLKLMFTGHASSAIAAILGISERTITAHREHIFRKMNAKSALTLAIAVSSCTDIFEYFGPSENYLTST